MAEFAFYRNTLLLWVTVLSDYQGTRYSLLEDHIPLMHFCKPPKNQTFAAVLHCIIMLWTRLYSLGLREGSLCNGQMH